MAERILIAWRLWGYRVGSSGHWIDAYLMLNGCPKGTRVPLRKAWRLGSGAINHA